MDAQLTSSVFIWASVVGEPGTGSHPVIHSYRMVMTVGEQHFVVSSLHRFIEIHQCESPFCLLASLLPG
jgi:hypothetical protein